MTKLTNLTLSATLALIGTTALAQQPVSYSTQSQTYEGYLYVPEATGDLDGKSILIAHDFLGPSENQFSHARDLSDRGATVFVADFYGADVRPEGPEAATAEAIRVRGNVPELRAAMSKALGVLTENGATVERTAVIGTSVGGLAALELGRTGVDLGGIVVLWGVLENTAADTAQPISAPVTLLQGDLDPLAPSEARDATVAGFESQGTEHDVTVFEGVAHAFTLPFMGNDPATGFAFDEAATEASFSKINAVLGAL